MDLIGPELDFLFPRATVAIFKIYQIILTYLFTSLSKATLHNRTYILRLL